ncbi:MAG TPA: LysR family transcriptional regulator [Polyangiales bacterium]|nr:LysR family transcriptional regulator [Polyangiales bacterium]
MERGGLGVADPEWSDFKVLLALRDAGSVVGAARLLGVDHSTVSRRLAALETAVGACLLVRNGREFAWTAAGRSMLAAAESIKPLVEAALSEVRGQGQAADTAVRISMPPAFTAVVSRLLAEQRAQPAGVKIVISGDYRPVDLAKGEADLALRSFRPREPGLISRPVLSIGWVVCASPRYLAEHGRPASAEELADHEIVKFVAAMDHVAGPRWLEQHRGRARVSIQVDNTEVAVHNIALGAGIGVVPAFVAENRTSDIVRVFPEPVAYSTGCIVYHEAVRDAPRVKAAARALRAVLESNAALFEGSVHESRARMRVVAT